LNLTADSTKLAGELSHGQQQWLEIGMALALRPKLLLLDEPTAGMSPEETYQTGELILRLNASGTTLLVVEHDMTFVAPNRQGRDGAALRTRVRARVDQRGHRRSSRGGNLPG
jgi:ABC-type uncharacterized transport system ATPase subunit